MYNKFTKKQLLGALVALCCALFLMPAAPAFAAEGDITTVAGGGTGDGGPVTNASLNNPTGIVRDAAGNLYIADRSNNRIRKVDTNGTITTLAGNGDRAFGGDGGAATDATLALPAGIALDGMGNLYFADTENDRVRKIDANGIITTVAGNGESGYSGDGGPATEASLDLPIDVLFDGSGNWYIADTFNNRIRKVDSNGIITTVVGNGERGFSGDGGPATEASIAWPSALTFNEAGELYFSESSGNRIRKVDVNGIISTVAGNGERGFSGDGGAATEASFAFPRGLTFDGAGNLYIADASNDRIRKVDTNGIITTVAGNGEDGNFSGDGGPATEATLSGPYDVLVDKAGNLIFSDTFSNRVHKVDTNGILNTIVGFNIRDGGPATEARLRNPGDTAFDGAGNLYIADRSNDRIRKVDANGTITTVVGDGTEGFGGDGGPAASANLDSPAALAFDSAGNLYIADGGNHRVRKVDTNGIITTVAGNGEEGFGGDGGPATAASLDTPEGIEVDEAGNLYIGDRDNNRIRKVDSNGIITTVAGNGEREFSGDGGPATEASLYRPRSVVVDGSGNLYIADNSNNRVRKVDTNGIITTVAGNGEREFNGDGGPAVEAGMYFPGGLALDAAGNLYFADSFNRSVRKVDANGTIMTVAGNGTFGYSGDGGPAIEAKLSSPYGLSFDGAGNLYFADSTNQRIRRVEGKQTSTPMAEAGVIIEESKGISEVQEGSDKTAGYTLVLASQPTEDVLIELVEHDNKVSMSPSSVVFTADNWDQPQLIKVKAVSDEVDDGLDEAYIWHRIRTADPLYGVNYGNDVPFTGNGYTMVSDPRTVLVYIAEAGAADAVIAAGRGIVIEVGSENSADAGSKEMLFDLYLPAMVQ